MLSDGKADDKGDLALFAKAKKNAEALKTVEVLRADRAEERRKREQQITERRSETLKQRGITMGLPLFSQQRSYVATTPTVSGGEVTWPLLLVYPEEAIGGAGVGDQSDYLEQVSEEALIGDILAAVFPDENPRPGWDVNGRYRNHMGLDVLFREEWTLAARDADSDDERNYVGSTRGPEEVGCWRTVDKSLPLRKALALKGYVVPLFPVLYVVPRGVKLS